MKKTQLQDWRGKEMGQIETQLQELAVKLTGAYLAKSAGKLSNVAMVKNLRREIAQLKTIQREKMLAMKQVEQYREQTPEKNEDKQPEEQV
jgi:ribosomal protein L29